MKNKKLTDELLISFIEGNLSEKDKKIVQDLIDQSEKNFIKYSHYYASYKQMQKTEFVVTPDQLIQAANKKYGLEPATPPTRKERFQLQFLIDLVKNPKTLAFASIAASVVILFSIIADPDPEDNSYKFITRGVSPKYYKKMTPASVNLVNGLNVIVKNDSIFIMQPYKFKRSLIVQSFEQKVLLKTDFIKMNDVFLVSNLSKNDSIMITITTLDEEVFRKTFYLND